MPTPIRKVFTTPRFEKSFRKLSKSLQQTAAARDRFFRLDAFDPRLKTHSLKGELKGLWSYSVDHSRRILFEFLSSSEVLYHGIGSHDVYR